MSERVNGHDVTEERSALLRRLTVDLKIEAQTADDSELGPLVVQALREFIDANPATPTGKFESAAGLDVSWRSMNRYYAQGKLVGVRGINEHGREIDTLTGSG